MREARSDGHEGVFQSTILSGLFLLAEAKRSKLRDGSHWKLETAYGCFIAAASPELQPLMANKALILHAVGLLLFAIKKYAKQNNLTKVRKMLKHDYQALRRDIAFPLSEYMSARLSSNTTRERAFIKHDLALLKALKVRAECGNYSIVDQAEYIEGGKALSVTFSYGFIDNAFKHYMYLPYEFWRIRLKKYPYAPALLFGISQHLRMNCGKERAHYIGINELLRRCGLANNIKKTQINGKTKELIVKPLERNLDALCACFHWRYCQEARNFNEWTSGVIELEIVDLNWQKHFEKIKPVKKKVSRIKADKPP